MTIKQKKGVRAAVLTVLLLLLAITTFDSQNGHIDAQAESREVVPMDGPNTAKVEAGVLGVTAARSLAPPGMAEMDREPEPERVYGETAKVIVDPPMEVKPETPLVVVRTVPAPEKIEQPPIWGYGDSGEGGSQIYIPPDPITGPGPRPDPDPGTVFTPPPGAGDTPAGGTDGDRNRGHGNEADGYDEDNPGRGRSEGVGSSGRRGGNGRSGGSGGRGNSGGRGGKGRGKG